jgi:uncharacterized protein
MKISPMTRRAAGVLICAASLTIAGGAGAQQFYKLSSLAPGATPYVVNTTFAKIVNKYVPGVEIQVTATGSATRHALDAARGKIDFFMSAPVLQFFMSKRLAMYKKVKDAPELAKNLRTIFNFPIGAYHMVVYADSGIKTLKDIKGKRVFLGPPTGAARTVAKGIVEGVTGYKAGVDFKEAKFGFGPARQAFQDKQIDVLIDPTNPPSSAISQVTLTNKIRLLGLTDADWERPGVKKIMRLPGRSRGTIASDAYGPNQVNTEPVQVAVAWVGLGVRVGVPEDVVYKMTKAFWENIDEARRAAPWMKSISLKNAFVKLNMKLHPGAYRYYKEIGLEIPAIAAP